MSLFRIYVVSRASVPERPAMWRKLRDEGYPIVSSWIDEAGPGETASMEELWARIESEIKSSTALVFYAEASDLPLKGALVEVGMALAFGIPVYVVLPEWPQVGSWVNHPLVKECPSVKRAFHEIFKNAKLKREALNCRVGQKSIREAEDVQGTSKL